MDLKLAGKKALITGASQGIGLAIADVLGKEGCDLILVSRSISASLSQERFKDLPGSVTLIDADLASPGSAESLSHMIPSLDILINNAGAVPAGDLFNVNEDIWRGAWDLKVFGYINMCRTFYPIIKAGGGGAIVNIAGIGARLKNPRSICVATGNAAILTFTQSLGSNSHLDNIRVVAINPGPTQTSRYNETQRKAGTFSNLPFGRTGHPREIANAVAFLASECSGYTSGAVLTIDGGISAARTN